MFDGVHIGHQALLRRLSSFGAPSAVLTFPEHPLALLAPQDAPRLITQLPQKLKRFEELGVSVALVVPFTKEFALTPYDVLLESLRPSHLVFGERAAFGKGREGTPERVRRWASSHGVHVEYVEKTMFAGEPVSSSRVRASLALIEALLGRTFTEFS